MIRREISIIIAVIGLCVMLQWGNDVFMSGNNISNMLRQLGMYGILAVGVTFVMVQGGIDLSVGSVVGLTGVIVAKIATPSENSTGTPLPGLGMPLWQGIVIAMFVAMLIGLFHGVLITKLKLQPFIVTLGTMLLLRGISQVIVKGGNISLGKLPLRLLGSDGLLYMTTLKDVSHFSLFRPEDAAGGLQAVPLLPWPILIFIVVLIVAAYALHLTVFGRYLYAIGGNRDASVYSGLPVVRCEIITYVISSMLAGVAGCCFAGYIGQMSQNVGISYELSAIAAAVLGGVSLRGGEGTALSVLVGTALMRVIESGINFFKWKYTGSDGKPAEFMLGSQYQWVAIGTVILLAVILDQAIHMFGQRRKRAG